MNGKRVLKFAVPIVLATLGTGFAAASAEAATVPAAPAAHASIARPLDWVDTGASFGSQEECADWGEKVVSSNEGYYGYACIQGSGGWELWHEE